MSTSQEQLTGTLYSDERDFPTLTPEAQRIFDKYGAMLEELSEMIKKPLKMDLPEGTQSTSAWQEWEYGLRQIYKELISDAFKELNIEMPKGMEVHFSGSLAKAQATEFSDLDAFVIVENEEDIQKIKPVFDALNNLCQRIFTQTNKLYPDPIGINPSLLIGSVDSLTEKIEEGAFLNPEAIALSIISSKPILPRYALGEKLREKIHESQVLGQFCTAQALYNKAITDFTAPKANAEKISIKTHVMRPIDFILMGIRDELSLYNEDGSHLSAPGTLRLLRERAKNDEPSLPEEEIALIESVYNRAMAKRFQLHSEAKKEHDEMPYSEAEEMLVDVEKLRDMARRRVTALEMAAQNQAQQDQTKQPLQTEGFFSRNADTFKTVGIVSLVVLAAVGVGLALGGILAVPFAAAAGAAVLVGAAIGYGLFKAGQAIKNWIESKTKNNEQISESGVDADKGASIEHSQIPTVSPSLKGLGSRVVQEETPTLSYGQSNVLENQEEKATVHATITSGNLTDTEHLEHEPEYGGSGLSIR